MNNIKIIGIGALCFILGVILGYWLVGNSADSLGGGTRFPNGISADTTSPSAGQVRGTTLTITGASTLTGASTFSGTLSNTAATSTLGCLRIYQSGATTVSSSTFYLMASTTAGGGGSDGSFILFATSTKPAYCN